MLMLPILFAPGEQQSVGNAHCKVKMFPIAILTTCYIVYKYVIIINIAEIQLTRH
jgi:hypothetical protein